MITPFLVVAACTSLASASVFCEHPFGVEGDHRRNKTAPCIPSYCTAGHWISKPDLDLCCVQHSSLYTPGSKIEEQQLGPGQAVSLHCVKDDKAPPAIEVKARTLNSKAKCEKEELVHAPDSYPAATSCADGWTLFKHTGKCYKLFSGYSRRKGARQSCQKYQHGELASAQDQETNTFLGSLSSARYVMLGAYKDQRQDWHWYDGSPWNFTKWQDGDPDRKDSFPWSHDLNIKSNDEWVENCCEYPWICQSSSGGLDSTKAKAVYEPLVGMAAFMSLEASMPRGLLTVEGLTIEKKVVVTGNLVGTSGNAGSASNYVLTLAKLSGGSCENLKDSILEEVRLETWGEGDGKKPMSDGNIRMVGGLGNNAIILPQGKGNEVTLSRCETHALLIRGDYPVQDSIKACAIIQWLS